MKLRFAVLTIVVGATAAASHALAAEPTPPAAEAAAPSGPPSAWKEMSKEQKAKYMKEVVTPKMKVAFQAFDADEFAKFNCGTCHGKGAKNKTFKMPNPDIYVLPGTPEEFKALIEKKPKWMKFMGETVKPTMAALLGMKNFDPKAPVEGAFACHNCHTVKGK